LTPESIHCYFDLRRMVICEKSIADKLKTDPRLDSVVANPDQRQPLGEVYGGRRAVRFRTMHSDLAAKVADWLARTGIAIEFNKTVQIVGKHFVLDGVAMDEKFDGCIVATPLAGISTDIPTTLDQVEISIYYGKLAQSVIDSFPAYYILCHSSAISSSRIVNYDAYSLRDEIGPAPILAVEVLHSVGEPPSEDAISKELLQVLPSAFIEGLYRLPRSLKVPSPSINNAHFFDSIIEGMEQHYSQNALYFTGMRTDKGIFFSHHTIGLAYDAALECAERLS